MSGNKMYCNSDFKALLGENYGESEYGNLIANDAKALEFYLQNKETNEITQVTGYENKWRNKSHLPIFAVNGIPTTVCDFVGGEKNRDSYNFLIDLRFSEPINKAVFTAGSGKSFYPTKLNVYLADSKEEIFSKDIKPVTVFTAKNEDGVYSAEFEPTRVRFVRFEVEDTENDYFGGKLITVVKDIAVYGALNARQPSFGLDLFKKMKTTEVAPISVMRPYLYKSDSGWVNTEIKPVDDEILKEISREKIGDSYSKVIINNKNFINIGATDIPSEISTGDYLPDLRGYNKIYFFIKLSNSEGFCSGKIKLQVVTREHKFHFVPITLEPDEWTKIELFGIFDIAEQGDLRRIAVFVDDGNIETEITVGSLQAVKTIDPSVWNVDINGVLGMTLETVPEDLKKHLDQYNIII